jgi:cadmium resistance protein CadD (predicted permease)
MFESAILAVVAFASTDIDDAYVLLAFFASPKLTAGHIVMGQYLGFVTLVAVALVCSLLALAIPDRYVGFLGLLPIFIGVKEVWTGRREREAEPARIKADAKAGAVATVLSVAAVTIANGGDNIAVYVPLFAHQPMLTVFTICVGFGIMVAVWCLVAHWLVSHPWLGAPIRLWGHRMAPLVLIGLGGYILVRSGAIHI